MQKLITKIMKRVTENLRDYHKSKKYKNSLSENLKFKDEIKDCDSLLSITTLVPFPNESLRSPDSVTQ